MLITELKPQTRRYLCRDDYLSEGARLLRQVAALNSKSAQDAYAAWLERAKPTKAELVTVMRLSRTPRQRIIEG